MKDTSRTRFTDEGYIQDKIYRERIHPGQDLNTQDTSRMRFIDIGYIQDKIYI